MVLVSVVPALLTAHAHQLAALIVGVDRATAALRHRLTDLCEQTEEQVQARDLDLATAAAAVRAAEKALEREREKEMRAADALREAEWALTQVREAATDSPGGTDTDTALYAKRRADAALEAATRKVEQAAAELDSRRMDRAAADQLREAALALRGQARDQLDRGEAAAACAIRLGDLAVNATFLVADLVDLLDAYVADGPAGGAGAGGLRDPAFLAQIAGVPARHGNGTGAHAVVEGGGISGIADGLRDLLTRLDGGTADLAEGWDDGVGRRYRKSYLIPMIGALQDMVALALDIQGVASLIAAGLGGPGGGFSLGP